MKHFSILVLLFFVTTVLFLGVSCNTRSIKKSSGNIWPEAGILVVFNAGSAYGSIRAEAPHVDRGKLHSRRLREGSYGFTDKKTTKGWENINNDDYQPVDPSPSSKATVHAGPIEHGTPLLPYVPRYTPPPGHPKHVAPAQSPASPV